MKPSTPAINVCAFLVLIIALMYLSGCNPQSGSNLSTPTPTPSQKTKLDLVNDALIKGGKLAENTFYACMVNGYMQGLSRDKIFDQCATKLIEDSDKGFGGPMGNIGNNEVFDPNTIVSACNSGDPTRGQTSGYGVKPNYGQYTWGGDSSQYYGYTKEESERLKDEAIKEAEEANKLFWELAEKEEEASKKYEEAKKTGNQQAIDAAKAAKDEAYKKAADQASKVLHAKEEARADPNKRPPNVSHPAEDSTCQIVMQAALEMLRECNRTGWKDTRCQQLQAKMNGCPDPTLILVDPESGYSCGSAPDKEAVKEAWVKKCEQVVRYGPGDPSPCQPPKFESGGFLGYGKTGDVCNDPLAYVNPDAAECYGTLEVTKFGQQTIEEIAFWGLNNIGGPIIVFPKKSPKPPIPGPQPRTSPR